MTEAFAEQFLMKVSKEKRIEKEEAARRIQECIDSVALITKLEPAVVHKIIFSEEYMSECVKKDCDELKFEECSRSCFCVPYDEPPFCIPRRIPHVEKINEDPDRFAEGLSDDALKKLVKKASYLYYNYEGGGLEDNAFDALEYVLQKRFSAKGSIYSKIGAAPVDRIRTKLPIPLPSLTKMKPNNPALPAFIQNKICWSLKLDGCSGLVIFRNGEVEKIYTRGDGIIGGDVTFLKNFIKFPKPPKDYYVRGEFVLSKEIWVQKYRFSYSNPRSFVTAKMNSGYVNPEVLDIEFLAYEICYIPGKTQVPSPSETFTILKDHGFKTPEWGIGEKVTIFDLMISYKSKRASSEYLIDGLVLAKEERGLGVDPSKQNELKNPDNKFAFKMLLEQQQRKTKVKDVEWNISRYGKFIPVAIYRPVFIDGAKLQRASAHNARHIREWSMGKGTEITIVRSGDVIPAIVDVKVNTDILPIYPDDSRGSWKWEGKDIVLEKIEGNRYVELARNLHFFTTLGVPRLGEKTIEKLYDGGMKTIASIIKAKPADFAKIKGIGEKTANDFYRTIHEKMRTVPLDRFLEASSAFKFNFGRKLAKKLFAAIPNLMDFSQEKMKLFFSLKKIPGFGPKRIDAVVTDMPKFKDYLISLSPEDMKVAFENQKSRTRENANKKIVGKKFVVSWSTIEVEDLIYNNFGEIVPHVVPGVECVVSGNLMMKSDKLADAAKYNVRVYSVPEFLEAYKVENVPEEMSTVGMTDSMEDE